MKGINDFLIERGAAPEPYKGPVYDIEGTRKPHTAMILTIIDQLNKKPDYKGKDKELWDSAGQFVYNYLKELSPKEYEDIVKYCQLEDLRSQKELSAADVSMALSLKLHK